MTHDNIIEFSNPENFVKDSLTELLRNGAQKLIANAIESELQALLSEFQNIKYAETQQPGIIRNGYLPERTVQTGLGPISVKVPKIRDKNKTGIKFNSMLIPPYLKRSQNMNDFLPLLYLQGVSTNKFTEALSALFGEQAKGLSANTIHRLKQAWETEYSNWSKRDLSDKNYIYWWADGIYFKARSEESKQCIFVIVGVLPNGQKELVSLYSGYRESELSWTEMLRDLRHKGLTTGPKLAIGDGALGFWNALKKLYPETKHQRCWVHKTANILNKVPKSLQSAVKKDLKEIWMAETRELSNKALDHFVEKYETKYPKAAECLHKNKEQMLAFYDYPAEHWGHIRTTNPIESTFATVRLRTDTTKNCGSQGTIFAMVFKLIQSAQKNWFKIKGFKLIGDIINNVQFVNGVKFEQNDAQKENRKVA
jgi:putative transposase